MSNSIKDQFPVFRQNADEKPIVYLDSAATSQRPESVIKAVDDFYYKHNANPHRGSYQLGIEATEAYENARLKVASFINAKDPSCVIFTRNTTESMNLIAYSYGMNFIKAGDRVVITILEHHSNMIPWQQVCHAKGAKLDYIYADKGGIISDEEIEAKITDGVKLVAATHVSNVLGIKTPIEKIIKRAHEVGAVAAVDAAQSSPHIKLDVEALDADFLAFSGHKLYSPLGVGVLWGKRELLDKMPPFLTGGDMIDSVREQDATWAELPNKFEAGTQNAGGAVGLAAAIDWIESVGFDKIEAVEREIYDYAWAKLKEVPHLTVYGSDKGEHYGAIAFNVDDVHPHDVATILDADGVCIRSGHHCAQPLMGHIGTSSCCRASFAVYNTKEDVDALCASLLKVRKWLGFED